MPAVIYKPSRRRKRFPDNCVTLMESAKNARKYASENENYVAATILGPARSSEGFMIYYLIDWL
ncbi:MAG: hypothetical protein HOM84_07410 [Thiotrichales bacterium]|nr:hypothetical protein [Thiotrichales bacterium]MBT3613793.1 hypothetical protein [Thiotrichales bacterium]MBT3753233.1 hypothetical protein [Thiotrichales bacterium]MBT3837862.1 hypothetical protein [Thiotrichales bacterium]MBT4152085.1 hypothetical protein [Thiotrichales bacterium]